MNPQAIIAAVATVVQVAQAAIQLGKDAMPFVQALRETLGPQGKEITEADLTALEKRLDELSAELQQPLPPEEA